MTTSRPPRADWTTGEPRILVTTCARCHNRWYVPRRRCPVCGSGESVDVPAAGGGLCVGLTTVHVPAQPEEQPARLVLVELDEGPVVMGRVHDELLGPGDRAQLEFRPHGGEQQLVPSFAREKADP